MTKSSSNRILSHKAQIVNYGSAELQGFNYEDYACLQPISKAADSKIV